MVLVQTQNCTSQCLKLHGSVSQFFGTKRTFPRNWAQGGSPFFETPVFSVCLPIVDYYKFIYKFVLYKFTYINLYVNSFFNTILHVRICMYELIHINLYM
jgi:hypothetical protein